MAKRKLILAYGNPDRQDDGAGWYVLVKTANYFGHKFSDYNDDFYSKLGKNPDFFFTLQLTPELIDLIILYDEVSFIDASVGIDDSEMHIIRLIPGYQFSPLSHHLSPQSLLDISKSVHNTCPVSYLLTIPGSEFGFSNNLSQQARKASDTAVTWLIGWTQGLYQS